LKRILGAAPVALAAVFLMSCGGNSSSATAPTTSLLTKRAFVTNEFTGAVRIVDATTDKLNSHSISVGGSPQTMVVSADKKTTLVFSSVGRAVSVIDNATEAVSGAIGVGEYSDSLAISSDGKLAYVAVRNGTPSTGTPLGVVAFIDITALTATAVDVPLARRLVLGPNGAKLLVFSDNSDSVTVIDTASKAVTVVGGFDRPVWGVFSSDSSKAYILNCGPECGGFTASVTELNNLGGVPSLGTNTTVSAATMGVLDGANLYVAGTVATGAGGGRLDVLNTSGLSVSKSGVVINDGYHTTMAVSNGRLFVGSRACSNLTEGCLSIYNSGAGTAAIGTPKGEVTGMQAISGRNIVYVCEGGELRIYDSSTSSEKLPAPVNIVGKAWDVKTVD